jgi:hypothetical protein
LGRWGPRAAEDVASSVESVALHRPEGLLGAFDFKWVSLNGLLLTFYFYELSSLLIQQRRIGLKRDIFNAFLPLDFSNFLGPEAPTLLLRCNIVG